MKFLKSKKGIGVDDLFPLIFALIVIVVVVSFFVLSPEVAKAKNNDLAAKDILLIQSQDNFNRFLKTSFFIDSLGEEMNMAELFVQYYVEQDDSKKEEYKGFLIFRTTEILNRLEHSYENEAGVTLIRAFMIHLTDDHSEAFNQGSIMVDSEFKSGSAGEEWSRLKLVQPVPLPNGNILYILWLEFSPQEKKKPLQFLFEDDEK